MLSEFDILFLAGFIVNFVFALIIIRFIYYPKRSEHSYLFTFLAFNAVIYFIMGLFTSVEISIGAGFGLFALFSILRYRTETVPIHDMTYLFVMVALPIMNSILFGNGQYGKMILSNIVIIGIIWTLEKKWGFHEDLHVTEIVYEKIDLVPIQYREQMIADLKKRTGLDIRRVEIEKFDFLHDTVKARIYYPDAVAEKR